MVAARNSAMGFNRYIDRDIDAINPRTADREIPAGKISAKNALIFVIVNSIIFILVAYTINTLCFFLSFAALALLLGYSFTKRFTALCHFFLGLTLSIAPTAAYISVTGNFGNGSILILSAIVLLWSAGFDILYSLSDEEFDRGENLHSVPQLLGRKKAFLLSIILHLLDLPLLVLFYFMAGMGWFYIIGASLFALMLIYQHCIISPSNLKRLNGAFFTSNGFASIVFALFTIIDFLFVQ
jgi:4-hydroxybenzoate polyprenyltransferase